MHLYLVHCGFYDLELCDGLFEGHANFFVAAQSFEEARANAKQIPEFKAKRMHVDGLQQLVAVNGYSISLSQDAKHEGKTVVINQKHRELAPPAPKT